MSYDNDTIPRDKTQDAVAMTGKVVRALATYLDASSRELPNVAQSIRNALETPGSRGFVNDKLCRNKLNSVRRMCMMQFAAARQLHSLARQLAESGGDPKSFERLLAFAQSFMDQLAAEQEDSKRVLRQLIVGA